MAKIEKHPGIDAPRFSGTQTYGNNNTRKVYNLPKREAELMVMSESLEVQTKVYDRLSALEARATLPRTTATEATAALSFWDAAVKSLNIAPSGHLGGVRATAPACAGRHVLTVAKSRSQRLTRRGEKQQVHCLPMAFFLNYP